MNQLGSNKELAQNKLILLYIIDKINTPISNLQIVKLILENKFMNYFLLQQYLDELCEANLLIAQIVEGKTFYSITKAGRKTLEYFPSHIPSGIKLRIDDSFSLIRKKIKNETLITADFLPESENEYAVRCKVREDNFSLIDMHVTVGTKADARTICENWKNHSQEIYLEILESLTRKR